MKFEVTRNCEDHFPFVVLEGADGTGKSTVAKALATALGGEYIATPPPPLSSVREQIDQTASVDVRFLYYLAGVLHASDIARKVRRSKPVVCDRYLASTIAYHKALGLSWNLAAEDIPFLNPDITFQLTVEDEAVRLRRLSSRNGTSKSDLLFQDPALARKLGEQYQKFEMTKLDTTSLHANEVVEIALARVFELMSGPGWRGAAKRIRT
jgi:dTMP kinase